jgi:hypothetical protein
MRFASIFFPRKTWTVLPKKAGAVLRTAMLVALLSAPAALRPEPQSSLAKALAADADSTPITLWRGRKKVWTSGDQSQQRAEESYLKAVSKHQTARHASEVDASDEHANQIIADHAEGSRTALVRKVDGMTRYTVEGINHLYRFGRPSNNVTEAGLLIHQHDNTERRSESIYKPGLKFRYHWATSLINQKMPGLYNKECGVILDPNAVRVLCSYYADFVSWTEGCNRRGLGLGGIQLTRRRWIDPTPRLDQEVSKPRDTPYPPEQLEDMMNMSLELQEEQVRRYGKAVQLRAFGDGEPEYERFWLGQYNEVLVDSEHYLSGLPNSLAAVFYVEGGGGEGCALKAHNFLWQQYGMKPEELLLLVHRPGADPPFVRYPEERRIGWTNGRPLHNLPPPSSFLGENATDEKKGPASKRPSGTGAATASHTSHTPASMKRLLNATSDTGADSVSAVAHAVAHGARAPTPHNGQQQASLQPDTRRPMRSGVLASGSSPAPSAPQAAAAPAAPRAPGAAALHSEEDAAYWHRLAAALAEATRPVIAAVAPSAPAPLAAPRATAPNWLPRLAAGENV